MTTTMAGRDPPRNGIGACDAEWENHAVQVSSFPEGNTPPKVRAQVLAIQEQAWPSNEPSDASHLTHDPALRPVTVILEEDGHVVSALDLLHKQLVHAGQPFSVVGLSTVVTDQQSRGSGFGHHLVAAARQIVAVSGADLGLFTCDRELQGFYEHAGWRHLPDAVLVGGTEHDPFPSDQPGFDKVTMADFFTDHARRHRASFINVRIALFPGQLDHLW